jgi:hypothetical protein
MAKLIAKLQPLTDACINAGVKMLTAQEGSALAEHEFFKKIDASGLDLVNIETDEGDVELGRIADAHLVKSYGEGALEFINNEANSGKAHESKSGKTKTQLQAVRRGYKRTLKKQIIKHLSGKTKPEGRRKKSVFERCVQKIRPEMNAIQKLEAPAQRELDLLMLLRKVSEFCSSSDPAASEFINKAVKNDAKKK